MSGTEEKLLQKIKSLSEHVWENRIRQPEIDLWLSNFTGQCLTEELEKEHALYLLSKFLFYGKSEVHNLLQAMFQDLFRNRLTVAIRHKLSDRDDFDGLHQGFLQELSYTRFLGLGNPAESATHILYDFRVVNALAVEYFGSIHNLFSGELQGDDTRWNDPSVCRLVFLDDFCGSGHQAEQLGQNLLPLLREVAKRSNVKLELWYLTMISTTEGLDYLRRTNLFDLVDAVSQMDATYKTFSATSQVYRNPPQGLTRMDGQVMANGYGSLIEAECPLGYGDSQLLLGFHHNVPDNTLPIFRRDRSDLPWHAIFPRYEKYVEADL